MPNAWKRIERVQDPADENNQLRLRPMLVSIIRPLSIVPKALHNLCRDVKFFPREYFFYVQLL